jgi:hypothetical protein
MTNKEWIEEYKKDLAYYDKGIFYHGEDEKENDNYDTPCVGHFKDDYDQNYEWDEPTIKHFQD